MRWKFSILSFILTLIVGLGVGLRTAISDWMWPSFNYCEARQMINASVRYRQTGKFRMMKCVDEQPCLQVGDGERGTVIGIEPVPDGGYFLKVRWDQHTNHYISYFGRYTLRMSLRRASKIRSDSARGREPANRAALKGRQKLPFRH